MRTHRCFDTLIEFPNGNTLREILFWIIIIFCKKFTDLKAGLFKLIFWNAKIYSNISSLILKQP